MNTFHSKNCVAHVSNLCVTMVILQCYLYSNGIKPKYFDHFNSTVPLKKVIFFPKLSHVALGKISTDPRCDYSILDWAKLAASILGLGLHNGLVPVVECSSPTFHAAVKWSTPTRLLINSVIFWGIHFPVIWSVGLPHFVISTKPVC